MLGASGGAYCLLGACIFVTILLYCVLNELNNVINISYRITSILTPTGVCL